MIKNKEELLSFLKRAYTDHTATKIYTDITDKWSDVGNYQLQTLRSLVYMAVRHPSVFEQAMDFDDPRDIILTAEELNGAYGHWFSIALNDIDQYILSVKAYDLEKGLEMDIKDPKYWNYLETQERDRGVDDVETISKVKEKELHLDLIKPKRIDPNFSNEEIAERVWNLRKDALYEFFSCLVEKKPRLAHHSDLDDAIIGDLITRVSKKLHQYHIWHDKDARKLIAEDILKVLEQDYQQDYELLLEKMYDVLSNKDLNIGRERLIRAILIHMNGDITIWDEILCVLSPEEIIVQAEYEKGVRIRNLNQSFDTKFTDDAVVDTVKLLASELYDNRLPF